jgi:polyprenyl P-hydroxybenzoate/phenylacrylic acid decarboxylase-like protein
MMNDKKRLVVGVSGASGASLAVTMLKAMRDQDNWETHLVVSAGAQHTIEIELTESMQQIAALATQVYDQDDIGARIASGTFKTAGMVIIPCSMKTLAGIAHGYADNLLIRAADVTIKENRTLVLVAREMPLSPIHLRNMSILASLGVTLMPPMMTFYNNPRNIMDMQLHIVGKVLNQFGIEAAGFRRWNGSSSAYSG